MDSRPEYPFTPSQHGAPCPHEAEGARYGTLADDLLMTGGALLIVLVVVSFAYFVWWA